MRLNSKAVALMIVLAIILLLIVLIVIGIKFTLSNTVLSYHTLDKIKAFYFAEAGIQWAMFEIKTDVITPPPTTAYPYSKNWTTFVTGQTVIIKINDPPDAQNNYTVTSDCTYETSNKKIQATVSKAGSTVQLKAWQHLN